MTHPPLASKWDDVFPLSLGAKFSFLQIALSMAVDTDLKAGGRAEQIRFGGQRVTNEEAPRELRQG